MTFVLWAYHQRVKRWLPILRDLSQHQAVQEITTRQDRVRRLGEPCAFRVLPEGEVPREVPVARNLRRG